MIYVVPAAVIILLGLMFWQIIPIGQQQRAFANMGRYLLTFILMIKPISVLIKRYLNPTYRKLPDGIFYLMKGRTQEPILIYIKNLIINTVYSLCLYGLKLRKRLGILAFWAIILHRGIWEVKMILMGNPMLFLKRSRLIQTGVVGLAALIIGALTSNIFSIKLLQRRRRPIQQIAAYIAFVGACLHIFFIEYERSYLVLCVVYIVLKIRERRPQKKALSSSGPAPSLSESNLIKAKIINRKFLTYDVLELTMEVHQELKIIPGQWALLSFQDHDGQFYRAYSLVDHDIDQGSTLFVLCIRLSGGRATKILSTLTIGQEIFLKGIYGKFVLQDTDRPKVFIGTGVGIVPLIHMAKHCPSSDKKLFFSVRFVKDVFYEDRIQEIPDVAYEIHTTQEESVKYVFGRLDVATIDIDPESEIYVCGKPEIVESIVQNLKLKGCHHIFQEKF